VFGTSPPNESSQPRGNASPRFVPAWTLVPYGLDRGGSTIGSMPVNRTVRALSLLALLLLVLSTGISRLRTNDLFIHLVTGGIVLDEGAIPTTDRYSFTAPGARYVTHEWLAAAWYALGERLAGTAGVIVASKLIPGLAILAALLAALRATRAHPAIAVGVTTLALAVGRNRLTQDRPELLALVALLTLLWLLLRDAARRHAGRPDRLLYWAIPLTAVWANLHASFPLGLALVAAFFIAESLDALFRPGAPSRRARALALFGLSVAVALAVDALPPPSFARAAAIAIALTGALFALDGWAALFTGPSAPPPHGAPKHLLGLLAGMLAAIALNPQGVGIYLFPFEFTAAVNPVTERIGEWRPMLEMLPALNVSFEFGAYTLYLATWAIALSLAAARGTLARRDLGILLLFGLLPLRHIRWIGLFALVTAPALAATLTRAHAAPPALRSANPARALVVVAFAGAALALAYFASTQNVFGPLPFDPAFTATLTLGALAGACACGVAMSRARDTSRSTATVATICALLAVFAIAQGIPSRRGSDLHRGFQWRRLHEVGGTLESAAPAVAYLRDQRVSGRLLTEYSWAGYAIHQLWPQVTVFLDSRSEVYGPTLLTQLLDMKQNAPLAKRLLETHAVELILVESRGHPYNDRERHNAGILDTVEDNADWGLLYFDDGAILYGRRSAEHSSQLPPFLDGISPRKLTPRTLRRADPEAEGTLREAIRRAPGASLPRFALASLLEARGERGEARSLVEDAWRANARQPAAPELAARLAAQDGDRTATRLWLERTLRVAPQWKSARARLEALTP